MKHLKLFESFSISEIEENNKMANDIVEDIKTISYLLEDEGFELRYTFATKSGNSFEVDEYNKIINSHVFNTKSVNIDMVVVKIIGRTITDPKTFQRTLTDSGKEAIERYINLLKEHLDYIDPNNITTQRSLIGNTNVIIKLFS
jgi:hypothetical protein